MASTTAPQAYYSSTSFDYLLLRKNYSNFRKQNQYLITRRRRRRNQEKNNNGFVIVIAAEQDANSQNNNKKRERVRAPPGVDTRIHWDNPDEGWIGGAPPSSSSSQQQLEKEEEEQNNLLGDKFADLLNDASGSHYQFLGIAADADIEEIKAAYRRLSKEYHPDTTSLPIRAASHKFMKLEQIYDVLSDEEKRKFYDWTLAQEAASLQAQKMRINLQDPSQQDSDNYQSVPDMVDRLGGKNMKLSDQAVSALTIDIFIIIFAICCIISVAFFKQSY